jgi:hypothetical protein
MAAFTEHHHTLDLRRLPRSICDLTHNLAGLDTLLSPYDGVLPVISLQPKNNLHL